MANRVGRKVYRTNSGNRKRKAKQAFKIVFFIIVLAALVFVGYSVAQPVYEYIANRDGSSAKGGEKPPWTPPSFAEEKKENSGSGEKKANESQNIPEDSSDKSVSALRFSAYTLPASALSSTDTLTTALNSAKENGYTAVIAVLKEKGGKIYYQTSSEMAQSDKDAIAGNLYAAQICAIIKHMGFIPIAQVNLLEDNNRYGEKRDGSYHFAGESSTWLDNSVANGGKPWLSPFDTNTQSYAAYLSNEVSSAGFDYVIFDGLIFPPFRNSDLNIIGNIVKANDRYKALVNVANIAVNAAVQNDSEAIVMISAGAVLDGTEEVFRLSELNTNIIAVTYLSEEISNTAVINGEEVALSELSAYERAEIVFGEIKRLAGNDAEIVPAVKQSEYSQADFSAVISALMSLGFDSYIVL